VKGAVSQRDVMRINTRECCGDERGSHCDMMTVITRDCCANDGGEETGRDDK
jgi:hypothetical protein